MEHWMRVSWSSNNFSSFFLSLPCFPSHERSVIHPYSGMHAFLSGNRKADTLRQNLNGICKSFAQRRFSLGWSSGRSDSLIWAVCSSTSSSSCLPRFLSFSTCRPADAFLEKWRLFLSFYIEVQESMVRKLQFRLSLSLSLSLCFHVVSLNESRFTSSYSARRYSDSVSSLEFSIFVSNFFLDSSTKWVWFSSRYSSRESDNEDAYRCRPGSIIKRDFLVLWSSLEYSIRVCFFRPFILCSLKTLLYSISANGDDLLICILEWRWLNDHREKDRAQLCEHEQTEKKEHHIECGHLLS